MARSIYIKEATALLRKALKTSFPGTKFSVRFETYSMGGHINVVWTDGPSRREVEAVADAYSGSRFDGSCDGSYYVDSWLLPTGQVVLATRNADGYSRGETIEAPCEGAELVRFSGSQPHLQRTISQEYEAKAQTAWKNLSSDARRVLLTQPSFAMWETVSEGYRMACFHNAGALLGSE